MTESPIDYTQWGLVLSTGSIDALPPNTWHVITLQQLPTVLLAAPGNSSRYLAERFEIEACGTDDDSTVVTATCGEQSRTVEGAASLAPEWTDAGGTLQQLSAGHPGLYACGASDHQGEPVPRFRVHEIRLGYEADDNADVAAVGTVWLAHEQHSDVTADYVRGPAVDTELCGPGYPVSAWHARTLCAESLNALVARQLQAVNCPLFGEGQVE